ncbi:unnamed protein product [Clonostachys rosea]|uniref:Uncharacterized protein n=1 Tax=Bionectria ochroleuca TaxID=29856 RepID=A0ABY6UBY8_BIOOC|nr:unnamed protein product [Clonostachys rosea]
MHRLRGKKKVPEEIIPPRPSVESDQSGPFKMFGRSKRVVEEPKPEIDLATALPSSDDFRTSLLMTGLSARFSMLREQDDPSSKLGKASDDSVLFPRRQSRLDFGLNTGLADISEVASIRSNTYARLEGGYIPDDVPTTPTSVMSRGKPVEGNNLFGGRQKIYKISGTGSTKSVHLSGRALYEDDVAMSAFQKWRHTERGKSSLDGNEELADNVDLDLGPESPFRPDFNRRRETNSTTSSGPSATRNSTAATSVASSQPASSLKDWQPSTIAAQHSNSSTPHVERSVTRTRRLYEQSLTQDLQDHQSSALSRIDTLSRQRQFSRTPDLTPGATSPTSSTYNERAINERRPILAKASAPNLRSFSPPNTGGSQHGTIPKLPKMETRQGFTTSPPLSPPISETGEPQSFAPFPNDSGKPSGYSYFNRPTQQYDEGKFAQRQRQLQQASETPSTQIRRESGTSTPTSRSRSSSSVYRVPAEMTEGGSIRPEPTVTEEVMGTSFLDMGDDDESSEPAPIPARHSDHRPAPLQTERPADGEHPALRKANIPSPLPLIQGGDDIPNAKGSETSSPEDSPTLGPVSGLSGMVRQHLRTTSNTSSAYDDEDDMDDRASTQSPTVERPNHLMPTMPSRINTSRENSSFKPSGSIKTPTSPAVPTPFELRQTPQTPQIPQQPPPLPPTQHTHSDSLPDTGAPRESQEYDEFARHLADGARRVRERLTSYVESDHSRSSSPAPTPSQEAYHPPRGSSLRRPERSRATSTEGERPSREHSQSRAMKLLGLGLNHQSTSPPLPNHPAFENSDVAAYPEPVRKTSEEQEAADDKGEPVHAGLKAFRQARRELQRMKEKEVQQRYQGPSDSRPSPNGQVLDPPNQAPPPPSQQRSPAPNGWQDRNGPPVSYNRMSNEDRMNGGRSRTGSVGPYDRERSGSETSNYGPPRPRQTSSPYGDYERPYSPAMNGAPPQGYGQRPSGTPDYRRQMGMASNASSRDTSPARSPYPRPSTGNSGHMGMRPGPGASPNAMGSAPPLPPINPRRKQGSDFGRDGPPNMPMSDKTMNGRPPVRMSDDETNPMHFRQRLRKVTSEGNGLRGQMNRSSPPRDGMPQMPVSGMGGMK